MTQADKGRHFTSHYARGTRQADRGASRRRWEAPLTTTTCATRSSSQADGSTALRMQLWRCKRLVKLAHGGATGYNKLAGEIAYVAQ